MPNSFQIFLLIFLLALIPATGEAMKPPKSGKVVITMRDGQPCFSYPQDKEILKRKSYSFGYLDVSDGSHGGGWEIGLSDPYKKGLLDPTKPEFCIKYGSLNPGMKTIQPAKQLRFDTPYRVRMNVLVSWEEEGGSERRYVSDFCLICNAKGETILVDAYWDDEASAMKCLRPGQSPNRAFWQKLFGK